MNDLYNYSIKDPANIPATSHYAIILYLQRDEGWLSDYYSFHFYDEYKDALIKLLSSPEKYNYDRLVTFKSSGRTQFKVRTEIYLEMVEEG